MPIRGSAVMTGASEDPATVMPGPLPGGEGVQLVAAVREGLGEPVTQGRKESGLARHHDPQRRGPRGQRRIQRAAMLDTVPARVARAGGQYRGVGVQDGLDRPVSLGVDADLEAAGVEVADHLGQLVALEVQDARAVRRHGVGSVDSRRAAAHPAVGPDLDGLGGQLPGMTALQAGAEEPVHLVVHDQPVDPLAEQAGRVRLGEHGEGIAPHIGVAGRRQSEGGQPFACRPDEPGPGGALLGDVATDVPLEQREHRRLVHHAVQPAVAVTAERTPGRIRLPIGESRLPQRGRVQHADVQ